MPPLITSASNALVRPTSPCVWGVTFDIESKSSRRVTGITVEEMTTDAIAFRVFVAVFCGGLAILTLGMLWIGIILYRQNRHKYARPARLLRFIDRQVPQR